MDASILSILTFTIQKNIWVAYSLRFKAAQYRKSGHLMQNEKKRKKVERRNPNMEQRKLKTILLFIKFIWNSYYN
jgi:hypothetical protein